MKVMRVGISTNVKKLAGAIAKVIRDEEQAAVSVQSIGAGALNQAIKALAIARHYLSESNMDVVMIPSFENVEVGGEKKTAIKIEVRRC